MLWRLRARLGYWAARRLLRWRRVVRQPRVWAWMQGQYARMAALGHVPAQSFYGHILLFRGQGLGAREEGLRLLRLAAQGGDGKAAYQLGVQCLAGDCRQLPDAAEAAFWWEKATEAGHPLAPQRLAVLYREGGPGLATDTVLAGHFTRRAEVLGFRPRG
jgi:TPR repeat protein